MSTVIVWGNNVKFPYDYVEERFLTVADYDENLAQEDLSSSGTFIYADPTGKQWLVAVVPFFEVIRTLSLPNG